MIPFFVGILILVVVFGIFYFIRSTSRQDNLENNPVKVSTPQEINKDDVVLALLTEKNGDTTDGNKYAILWNGVPDKTYDYIITELPDEQGTNGREIAKGQASSTSSVFKIKGIPLEEGKVYDVTVGDASLRIPFTPPRIDKIMTDGQELNVTTDVVPTNIEIIVSTETSKVKIPLSECQIKIEPPGFICKMPQETKDPVMVIYNGPNAVNILM